MVQLVSQPRPEPRTAQRAPDLPGSRVLRAQLAHQRIGSLGLHPVTESMKVARHDAVKAQCLGHMEALALRIKQFEIELAAEDLGDLFGFAAQLSRLCAPGHVDDCCALREACHGGARAAR